MFIKLLKTLNNFFCRRETFQCRFRFLIALTGDFTNELSEGKPNETHLVRKVGLVVELLDVAFFGY